MPHGAQRWKSGDDWRRMTAPGKGARHRERSNREGEEAGVEAGAGGLQRNSLETHCSVSSGRGVSAQKTLHWIRALLFSCAATLICTTASTFSYLPSAFWMGLRKRTKEEERRDRSLGARQTLLWVHYVEFLKHLSCAIKCCCCCCCCSLTHMWQLQLCLGLSSSLGPRARGLGMERASPWRDSAWALGSFCLHRFCSCGIF